MADPARAEGWEVALEALLPECELLEASRALRRLLPPDQARRATELLELRRRARGRLPAAGSLRLTRKGLEQATAWPIARERARTLAGLVGGASVLDATAGVGGDALALAGNGFLLVAADRDPEHARCTAANLARAGHEPRVVVAEAARPAVRADVLVLDPDRRAGGRRSLDPERFSPTWSACLELAAGFPSTCVKLAPALDVDALEGDPRLAALSGRAWRWTSLAGELAETALWTGDAARGLPGREAVLVHPDGATARLSGEPRAVAPLDGAAASRVAWIHEPDPAVVRSGLLGHLAERHGLAPLGPGIGFLGGDAPAPSPFLAAYRVVDAAPADRRRVRRMLREHDVGPLVVRKRGHPLSGDELARRLRGSGERRGTLLVARLADGHRAFLVERAVARARG